MADKRKAGAPPGNLNALKHGFYSRFFTVTELTDIEALNPDLTAEIALLRVITRRLFDRLSFMEEDSNKLDIEDYESLTSCLTSSIVRLATIMRTNLFLTGDATDLGAALADALSQTITELNLK